MFSSLSTLILPSHILSSFGLIGVILIIFAESGLFFGFFLPGDSLIFTAGLLASQGFISLPLLLMGTFAAAVFGDSVGYWFGKKIGKKLFSRPDSRFFKQKYLTEARKFYDKHGGKAIIYARFVPIVRTFAPIVAGAADMKYRTFLTYNVIGGFIWAVGMGVLGYTLGNIIPNADEYITPIVIGIIIISFIPPVWQFLKARKSIVQ